MTELIKLSELQGRPAPTGTFERLDREFKPDPERMRWLASVARSLGYVDIGSVWMPAVQQAATTTPAVTPKAPSRAACKNMLRVTAVDKVGTL